MDNLSTVLLALLLPLLGVSVCIALLRDQNGYQLSCPRCDHLCKVGARPLPQIVCAVLLFPFGMLGFLAGRRPTGCENCGHRWMA